MSIRLLKGIGPARAASLERLGVRTIADAVLLMPRRYEDRRSFTPIGRLRPGETASVLGRVKAAAVGRTRRGIPYCEMLLDDRSGTLVARWYRQPYLTQTFRPGLQVILTGKLNPYPPRQMVNPEHEVQERDEAQIHAGRIVPVYPLTAGLAQRFLRRILFELAQTVCGEAGGSASRIGAVAPPTPPASGRGAGASHPVRADRGGGGAPPAGVR